MTQYNFDQNSPVYKPSVISGNSKIEWWQSIVPVSYPYAISTMKQRIDDIAKNSAKETIWFLEHPSIITKGIRAQMSDLLNADRFPIFETNRGGQFTYHGPGQLIIYVMLNLAQRTQDVRKFVCDLEQWGIDALKELGVHAERKQNRVGLWVNNQNEEKKIAAIGVRITKWVTWHGMSININPDLCHFQAIVPCGLKQYGTTSLAEMNISTTHSQTINGLMRLCPF